MASIERVVFFGSPEFSIPTLETLAVSSYRPMLIVSQPSRRAGRGHRLQDPPVAQWAREAGIELVQPEKVRAKAFVETLAGLRPDVAVVVAFGQIFPSRVLEIPRFGCVNLHASLLPVFRGAAPIQAAIAAGEEKTGVTTMLMEAGLDTGPILLQRSVRIGPHETSPELATRLAQMGGELMVETLQGLGDGSIHPAPQGAELASYAPRLRKKDGLVEWTLTAAEIERRLRAFQPWPGLTTACLGQPLKLVEGVVLPERAEREIAPGFFLGLREGSLAVACGGTSVLGLRRVQRPGRRVLCAADFLRGERLTPGQPDFSSLLADEKKD